MFSIRAVILDHYMSNPINELYVSEHSSDLNLFQEPVIRIFGSNADGHKSCVHIHGVYPYVYVPYEGGENPGRDCLLLGAALDEALAKANDNQKNPRYVYKVILTSKIPLYGYHSKHRQFFQIFFCNPYYIRKAIELLWSGAILGRKFQPYEAHIPYALQFMIDYNIYGMSFVTFSKVKYRKNPENPDSLTCIKTEDILSNKVKKITCCYFEVDALAQDILNKTSQSVVGVNPGLEAIWHEEKIRRRACNKPSQITIPSTVSRPNVCMSASEIMYKKKLARKLEEITFEKPEGAISTIEPEFSSPAEIPESDHPLGSFISDNEIEQTQAEGGPIIGNLIDQNILSQIIFSQKEIGDSESEEERIEADSILGRNQNEEEEAEFEDDVGGDMTQPLDTEENMMCESDANRGEQRTSGAGSEESFWKIMADKLFQFDGGQDSSSESDPDGSCCNLPRFSNPQVSVDTMLACCNPDGESVSNWSNNILSILSEDNVSQGPQIFWSNYSSKMDSSWLYDNSREPWIWSKNETDFDDCFFSKQKCENLCDLPVGTEEFSKKKAFGEMCGNRFEWDQLAFSEYPFENIGSVYPTVSPPQLAVIPSTNFESYSDNNLHSVCKEANDTLKSPSPPDEKTDASQKLEKDMKTIQVAKDYKCDKFKQDKFLNVLNTFSAVDRKQSEQGESGKIKPLTLKQYIRDCEEIVNIDFKNFGDKEMVIIEYKPLNGKSSENKFLIKPLDKFLENWNSAEKKVNNEEEENKRDDDCWGKTFKNVEDSVISESPNEKNNLCGIVNSLEHKNDCDLSDPVEINSIKNKFMVKSTETPPESEDRKTYKINENVISQGKIKMKLTKSPGNDFIGKCSFRGKTSKYVNCNKSRDTHNDVNANHISLYTCRNYLKKNGNKLKKTAGEEFGKKPENKFYSRERRKKISIIELEEIRRKKKEKEIIKRKRSDDTDRFPKKLKKKEKRVHLPPDCDSKIINKINSCFEEYYKNIVKVNNFNNENDKNYFQRSEKDSEEEFESDRKKFINSVVNKRTENNLNYSDLDPVKFVTRLLSSFSHMSQSSEIPPLSITISLGNVSNTSNTSTAAVPIQLNLQPTVNVPPKLVKYFNKNQKKKMNFQNVDGPADSSSEDSGDSNIGTSNLKGHKKDGFYKPLKLIAHNSESVESGKKRKVSNVRNKKDIGTIKKNSSSSLEVGFVNFSENSTFSPFLDEGNRKRKAEGESKEELTSDFISSRKNRRKVRKWPLISKRKSRLIKLFQSSSDSGAEPDFISDSENESQSKKLSLKEKTEKVTTKNSNNFLLRIPQADVDVSTSEDENVEIELKNPFERSRSTVPFTVLDALETNENSSQRIGISGSNAFEFDESSTSRVANWRDEDLASSSKVKENCQSRLTVKNDSQSNSEAGFVVSALNQYSSKLLTLQNFKSSNEVMALTNQNLSSSLNSTPLDLNMPSPNLEDSLETSQKVFFKSEEVIQPLPQTGKDNLVAEINAELHPPSINVAGGFDSHSDDLVMESPNSSQQIPISSNCKSVDEFLGQLTGDVSSAKSNSFGETNSSKHPVYSGNSIFSQCSSTFSSKTLKECPLSEVTSISGTKIIVPKKKPPIRNSVFSVLHEIDFSPGWNEVPFFSDSRDRFKTIEMGPKILKIKSNSVVTLKTFKSSLDLVGTEERRKNIFNYQVKECHGARHLFVTDGWIKIIPLRKAPTSKDLSGWLEIKNESKTLENKLESTKTKVLLPLSPENESGPEEEMDLSMTLSTPIECSPGNRTSSSINFFPTDNCLKNPSNNSPEIRDSQKLNRKLLTAVTTEEPKVKLKKGPLNKIKGIKRLSFRENLKVISEKAEVQENSLIGKEDVYDKTLAKDSKQSSENSFQIRGITLNNTFGFDNSVENMQNIKLQHTHQNMSMMVMEVHVLSRKDFLPDPRHDSIRALFYTVKFDDLEQNQETGIIVVGKQVLSETGISVKTVHYVPTELELINRTIELTRTWDPDILAGYEIEMNSWGYLIQRGFILEKNLLYLLGRVQNGQSGVAPSKGVTDFLSESDEYYETPRNLRQMKVAGRIVLDIWRILRHEVALTSYTFENVMYHLTHERHPVFSHKMLSFYWEHKSHRFRHITVEYYLTRVLGVVKLLDQLDFISRTSELARLFGIQFYEVLSRGSQFRVESMMLRLAKPLHYIPTSPSIAQRAAMRAPASLPLILEPESKFYADPVIVLDFQSLYPSMIIAYNYCFSTCLGRVENLGSSEPFEFGCTQLQISPEELKRLENDITISPAGVAFVKANIRRGVLPAMLEEILETRLMVKKSMKENKGHKTLEKLLFARQLGLKLIANVTYGYTAANFSGRMPCIEVGDSVVSKGRETLHRAIQLIKNTPKWGAKVVYGDTDSIFVLTPGKNRQQAFQVGVEIAEAVTQSNPKPVKLKLEKVYQPSILQTKKRYVGYMYESPEQSKPIFEAKGIETVRRDGCPAVGKILQKALRILFDTRDVSLVKKYTVRQFSKLFQGRVNIQDLIFAKEYRGRKGYRAGACVPALQLAKQWTEQDKRAEPRVKERVPYVIVNGPPGVPLIQCVRSPKDLISDPSLTISPVYYITKAIIPPMQRCFSLIGVDIMSWYLEMPRKYHKSYKLNNTEEQKKSTISQYFSTTECIACSEVTNSQICQKCLKQPQILAVTLTEKIRRWERCCVNTLKVCQSCCGRPTELECESIDCPVFFRRSRVSRDLNQAPILREIMRQHEHF